VRAGVLLPGGERRRALVAAIERAGDFAVAVGPVSAAGVRNLDIEAVDGWIVAASVLDAAPDGVFARPWCLLDDGGRVRASDLRGAFGGVVPAPSTLDEESVAGCVASLTAALRRGLDAELEAGAIASMAAGVLGADASGHVRFTNPAYVDFLGGPAADPVGRGLAELLHPVGDAASAEAFQRALAGGPSFCGEVRLEGAAVTTVFAAGVASIRSATGVVVGTVATLHDLSARVAVEESLRAAQRQLERRAWTDPLTGLANRAFFDDALERQMARTRRDGTPTAVLLVDLDDFKRINDVHGHDVGDEVLAAVSGSLRVGLREGDVLARYGGDEFCVLLVATDAATARAVGERVRASVAALRSGPTGAIRITTSIGLATTRDLDADAAASALVRLADRAMYAGKNAGGDRVTASAGADAAPAVGPRAATPKPPARRRSDRTRRA